MIGQKNNYLRDNSINGQYERWLERYTVPFSDRDDRFLFEKLIQAIFSGGMSGAVVDTKMPSMGVIFDRWDFTIIVRYSQEILNKKMRSPAVISNKAKLMAMVVNAREVCRLREQFGSFGKYLTSLDFETLVIDLQRRFEYLGPVTAYDFLRNIGFDTIKPDRHVRRWLIITGILSAGTDEKEAISVAKEIAQKVGISLPQLDSIIYLFCASRSDIISGALCGDHPKCSKCPISQFCDHILDDHFEHKIATPPPSIGESKGLRQRGTKDVTIHKRYTRGSIMIENEEKAQKLFDKIKDERVFAFLKALMKSLNEKIERCYAVTHEFKYVLPQGKRCSFYIRPSSRRIDIYFETFSQSDIYNKSNIKNLPVIVKENTSNPKDQFKSVVEVNGEWLITHKNKADDLLDFINGLIDDLADYYV